MALLEACLVAGLVGSAATVSSTGPSGASTGRFSEPTADDGGSTHPNPIRSDSTSVVRAADRLGGEPPCRLSNSGARFIVWSSELKEGIVKVDIARGVVARIGAGQRRDPSRSVNGGAI
jgi:hypothetical protein